MKTVPYLIFYIFLSGITFANDTEIQKKVFTATVNKDGIQRVEIVGGEYFYDPDYIIIKKDAPVAITIRKKPGIVPHNIVINKPDAGINFRESISSKPKIIKFTPIRAGKYLFYCDKKLLFFKSHRARGMEGVFEVIE